MMIATCNQCQEKYKIDPAKIPGQSARFKCKSCGNTVLVTKPAGEASAPPSSVPGLGAGKAAIEGISGMAKKRLALSIFPKMLIAMLGVALLPVAGLWYIDYLHIMDRTDQELRTNLTQTSDILAGKVNSWIDINIRSSRQIARTADIISMEPVRQYPLLKATDDTYEWSYTAFTADLKGMAVTRSDGKPLKYYGDREYVQTILKGGPVGQQVLISRVNGKPALCLSVPVRNSEAIQGVLVQCSKLVEITKAVAVLKIGKTGVAFLVDRKNRLISHGDQSKLTENLMDFSANPAVRLGQRGDGIISFKDNGREFVAHTKKLSLDWLLVVQQDYDEAFAPLIEARNTAFVVLGVTVFLVTLVAFIFAGGLSKPIRKLTMLADQYSRGKMMAAIPGTQRSDEIGALARAIDRLGTSFKMAMEKVQGK